ncbi:MAG TPA: hypothetical protein VI386_11760, partial [Candidatus Sulfotelmatobacter sp.]
DCGRKKSAIARNDGILRHCRLIGLLLGPDVQELLRRCEEHVALTSGNYLRLLPQCFRHPRQALLALLENLPLSATSQDRSVIDAVAFVLANQNARRISISVDDTGQKEALNLSFQRRMVAAGDRT